MSKWKVTLAAWKFLLFILVLLVIVCIADGFGAMLVTLFLVALVTLSFLLAAWQMKKNDILWTSLGFGQIKSIDSGEGNPVKMISDLPGHYINSDMEVVEGGPPRKTFLEKNFGMYWIGLPPHTVHDVTFTHERINQNISKSTPSTQWVQRDKEPTTSKYLLWEIPHTVVITDLDFRERFQGDILLEFRSRIVFPKVALYLRQGKFLDYAKEYFKAGAQEQLRKFDWIQFSVDEPKMSGSDLLKAILATINSIIPRNKDEGLAASTGIVVLDGFISRFEPNEETKKFLEAQEEAKLTGQAAIETATQAVEQAKQAALKLQIEAEAALKAAQTEAAGQTAVFNTILESILARAKSAGTEIDFPTALQTAAQLAIATKMSAPDSPVTVLGAGINIGVNNPPRRD